MQNGQKIWFRGQQRNVTHLATLSTGVQGFYLQGPRSTYYVREFVGYSGEVKRGVWNVFNLKDKKIGGLVEMIQPAGTVKEIP